MGYLGKFIVWVGIWCLLLSVQSESAISASGTPLRIRVGVYDNPPKVYCDPQGNITGIYPDIISSVAQVENWRISYVRGTWEQCLSRLKEGRIDILVDVAYSKERDRLYEFSDETVFVNWGALYVKKGIKADSFTDLANKTIAVMKGSIHTDGEQGIKAVMKGFDVPCRFIEAEDYKTVISLVSQGKADAGVVNRLFGVLNVSDKNLVPSPIIFNPQNLKFAFPRNANLTPYLKEKIDARLQQMKNSADSMYYRVMARYLSGLPGDSALEIPAAVSPSNVSMTPDEAEWIKSHPTVRLGFDPGFSPFEFKSEKGIYSGIAADYCELISQMLGMKFVPVYGITWNEAIENAKNKSIDVLPCIGSSKERQQFLSFSKPYLFYPRVIITRSDSTVKSLDDLPSLKVGVQDNSSHLSYLKEKTTLKPILFKTFQDALLSVSKGESDAAIGNLAVYTDTLSRMSLTNLKIAAYTPGEVSALSFAVRKDWPILTNIINKTFEAIPESEKLKIARKWVPVGVSGEGTRGMDELLPLTDEETAFLKSHPVIRIGVDPAYPPFEWIDKRGNHQGISADFIKRIERKLGVSMDVVPSLTWPQVLDGAKNRSVDVLTCVSITPSRKEYLNFTQPYLSFPIVIFTRTQEPFINGLKDLDGKTVTVVKGYAPQEPIEKNYPAIRLKLAETPEDGLEQVSTGISDAFVENLAVGVYLMQQRNITNLKVAGTATGIANTAFSMGVRSDWPQMVTILDKALQSISPKEQNEISSRWMSVRIEQVVNWRKYLKVIAAVSGVTLFILLTFLYWNRKLAREITIRRRVEEALKQAKNEADQANRAKSIFLANMSHEIRTPMNAILGYSQLLHQAGLPTEQKTNVDIIMRSGEHLLHLINDILEMSKIESGHLQFHPSVFDLHGLLNDVRLMISVKATSKGLHLDFAKTDDVPRFISTDEGKLRQILINLLGNAVKFTDEGYVALTIDARSEIQGGNPSEKRMILLMDVSDSGPGMTPDDLSIIFQSFEQTDHGRTMEGTGLGLAICREYLQFLGGDIHAESEPGKGSVFHVTLPVIEGRLEYMEPSPSRQRVIGLDPEHAPVRILVVDDKEDNRNLLTKMLKRVGFQVREAVNGMECIPASMHGIPI